MVDRILMERVNEGIKANLCKFFPSYDFSEMSNKYITPFKLDGSEPREAKVDKCFIYKNGNTITENGGETISLVTFFMRCNGYNEKNKGEFSRALHEICEELGIEETGKYSPEEIEKYNKRASLFSAAQEEFKKALFMDDSEAAKVLKYLREERKWNDEEIKTANLGYMSPELFRKYREDLDIPSQPHSLVIPVEYGSNIQEFVFRRPDSSKDDRFRNRRNFTKDCLFGLPPIGTKSVVIVEGALDYKRAHANGVNNVAATLGNALTDKLIKSAIERGCKDFKLLFDRDKSGLEFIQQSINNITRVARELKKENDVLVWVIEFDKEAKDSDEYISQYGGAEYRKLFKTDYQYILNSSLWECVQISNSYGSLHNGKLFPLEKANYLREIVGTWERASLFFQTEILDYLGSLEKDLLVKFEDIQEFIDERAQEEERDKKNKELGEVVSNIESLIKEGKFEKARELMREGANIESTIDKEKEFLEDFFEPITAEYLGEIRKGLPTGFMFYDDKTDRKEELTLNDGLTFVCAPTGHGKTSFLNNLVINEARRNLYEGNENSVLYFSYEVDKKRLILDLINTFVNNKNISSKPIDSILGYFTEKDKYRFFTDRDRKKEDNIQDFEFKKDVFLHKYLNEGKKIVVAKNRYKAETLLEAIKCYIKAYEGKVSLVVIDYAQLLYSEKEGNKSRPEEVKKIVNDIKDFSNEVGIPFVLAAQFNRGVRSPIHMEACNIGEAGDIERIADTTIGIFNLEKIKPETYDKETKKETLKLLQSLGELSGTDELEAVEGKFVFRLIKRRYGMSGIDCLLDWEGKTKYITPNYKDEAGNNYKWIIESQNNINQQRENLPF